MGLGSAGGGATNDDSAGAKAGARLEWRSIPIRAPVSLHKDRRAFAGSTVRLDNELESHPCPRTTNG
jgi:hypothetical protein